MNRLAFLASGRIPPVAVQFVLFAAIGGLGMFVDMAALWFALNILAVGPYLGRVISYLFAATFTWACNRAITFRGVGSGILLAQWAKFLMVNTFGATANFAVYAIALRYLGRWLPHVDPSFAPYIGVALGSATGLIFNFVASKRLVFR
ncbi:GtrA family protein [Phenylobacterium sp.]|uniref:GtrA family protein n=1 Tax=Phenylobacterium sp. TaxID=1871053 RepID=UPI00286B52C1|nr:GtrA family protein [Phenylobacterium sp.]